MLTHRQQHSTRTLDPVGGADASRPTGQLRRLLELRKMVKVSEAAVRLGLDELAMRAAVDALVRQGTAEILRPVYYDRTDHDYCRLRHKQEDRLLWQRQIIVQVRKREQRVSLRDLAVGLAPAATLHLAFAPRTASHLDSLKGFVPV